MKALLTQLQTQRVLITGARAPAALEWVRALHGQGIFVVAADTLHWPLTRFSNAIDFYERLPAPAENPVAYGQAVNALCLRHSIDLIIPTCEEVFYLAHQRDVIQARLLAPSFDALRQVHHKFTFSALSNSLAVSTPPTRLLQSVADLRALAVSDLALGVLKPAWSRFANQTIIKPTQAQIRSIVPTLEAPWLWQHFAAGREVCSYSIAVDGDVLVHKLYQPKHRVGQGSGIYFEPISNPLIEEFVNQFCKQLHWTGQVAFDYIETDAGAVVLECNPRATSGVHLMRYEEPKALQISFAMWLFGLPKALGSLSNWWHDYHRAEDVIATHCDPAPLWVQPLCLLEILWRAVTLRKSLLSAATADIEWNGEDLATV
jgi:hypothetical protein